MSNLIQERERVIRAISAELQLLNDEELDDLARDILSLPDRPIGAIPFVGWLTEIEKEPEVTEGNLKISQKGIDLIKKWEGFRGNAYLCPAGVWTIGYGHTKTAKEDQSIDRIIAEQLLDRDLDVFEQAVNYQVKVKLTQNQFDALVSFAFNCGTGALQQSTLLRRLNRGDYPGTASEFLKWVL